MASVKAISGPDGKPRAYEVRWRGDGVARERRFARKGDADRFATETEHSKYAGNYVDDRLGRVSVRDYGEAWRAVQPHRPNSAKQVRQVLVGHLYPTLGDRPVASVRRSDIQAWLKGRAGVLAPTSLASCWSWARALFKAAVADRMIAVSPCDGVTLPAAHAEEVEPPSIDEIFAVGAKLPKTWRAIAVLGAQTGLRPGELRGLTVGQVDFFRRTIRVDRQRDGALEWKPKTPSSTRTVPVDQVTLDLLAKHLAEYPAGPDGLVFHNERGGPLVAATVQHAWERAVGRAKVRDTFRMHDLRHFYASALIRSGASAKVVQKRLGHATAAETLRTYTHLWADDEDRTRGMIAAVFAGTGEASAVRSAR